ncbi:hypothetical protein [Armatimonas sp.]|uniref:hypothetical protein n=1 Tax=Armatimonas sp. TaxID=1872638 RepID=UPI00374D70C3
MYLKNFLLPVLGFCLLNTTNSAYGKPTTQKQSQTGPVSPYGVRTIVESIPELKTLLDKQIIFNGDAQSSGDLAKMLPNSNMFIYVMSEDSAASAGFILKTEVNSKNSIIIQEYVMFKEIESTSKKTYRAGVGVRMIISVNQSVASVSTLGIPSLAISAEQKKLKGSVKIQIMGISGKSITESAPLPSELNFTTLMQMYQYMDQIKTAIWSGTSASPVVITPQIVGAPDEKTPGT